MFVTGKHRRPRIKEGNFPHCSAIHEVVRRLTVHRYVRRRDATSSLAPVSGEWGFNGSAAEKGAGG